MSRCEFCGREISGPHCTRCGSQNYYYVKRYSGLTCKHCGWVFSEGDLCEAPRIQTQEDRRRAIAEQRLRNMEALDGVDIRKSILEQSKKTLEELKKKREEEKEEKDDKGGSDKT